MSDPNKVRLFNFQSTEFRLILLLFILLWVYLFIRAYTVFFIHDEIVTKWSYVVHWNPFPNQGPIDANNHFLLSLLAGFFTRLFNSDTVFVMRLGSVLSFPIYFWSIYRLKPFFKQKWNFYALLISLTTASFLIEFFGLARGYGLSLAFLMLSIQQMFVYFNSSRKSALIGALIGWVLVVYASLTLLPLMLFAILLVGFYTVRNKSYGWLIPILAFLVPAAYFIKYTFSLKELGKLYYGGTEGFFPATVHTVTKSLWYAEGVWLDVLLVLLTSFICFVGLRLFWKTKNICEPKLLFALFLFAGLGSIFVQHWLLDVNYPEDRTAMFLVVVFFGALFFALDEFEKVKWPGIISVGFSIVLATFTYNFTHSVLWYYEHLDEEMVQKIPIDVEGTPPTTGGKWNMENALTRELNLPFLVYQDIDNPHDTLADFIISVPGARAEITTLYGIEHLDPISGLALLKRKKFLKRQKSFELDHAVVSEAEFQTMRIDRLEGSMVLRCSGKLEDMTEEKEIFIVFSSEDSVTKQLYTYEMVPMIRNKKLTDQGEMTFDFSYAMNALKGATTYAAYIWNQNREVVRGNIKLEVYKIVD